MGTVERRQREHEETHEAIVDAAVEVFLAEGYEATSIRKIAKKIEYTPGAVYSYFKDKDEILYEIHLRGFKKFFEYLSQALSEPNPMERLHKTGELYLKFADENPEYYDLMFIERSTARTITDMSCWESGERAHTALVQMVAECMDQGYIPKSDPGVAAFGFWSLVHGIAALLVRKRCVVSHLDPQWPLPQATYDFMWNLIVGKSQ